MTRIWWILIRALSSLKNSNSDWSLLYKVKNVWPKKVQRSYILWHWRTMQNLKKLTCGLENDTRNLANFHQNTWKCQNWYFMGFFSPKWKMHELQLMEELQVMTLKNDKKIWRETDFISKLTWGIWEILTRALEYLKNFHFNGLLFETDIKSWNNFDLRTWASQNLHFNGLLLTKVYNVWAKKVQRSYVWWHWRLMQNLKENWLVLSKMTWGI